MSNGTIDFSQVDNATLKMRGGRNAIVKMVPQGAEVFDSALVKAVIGRKGKILTTLTVDSGITDNADGTFSVSIDPSHFKYQENAVVELYGLQNQPDLELAILDVEYIPRLK